MSTLFFIHQQDICKDFKTGALVPHFNNFTSKNAVNYSIIQ